MNLEIKKPDPLRILESTKSVIEKFQFVSIKEENLEQTADLIKQKFGEKGLDVEEMGFGFAGNFEDDLQLIFIEDTVNFCFWAEKDNPKWQVEDISGNITSGGWFGLKACFDRGLKHNFPILDAKFISSISQEDGAKFFQGINDIQIPLLREKINNLREAGKILIEKFDGKFTNVFNLANYDAIKIAKLAIENFPSFRDKSLFEDREVFFYKRAQILAQDISYILRAKGRQLSNLDQLTAFADYKLPQLLRMYGLIEYNNSLAERVDNYVQIPHDSREEIEIRAATIWAAELLRQHIGGMTAADIDNTIWLISQDIQKEAQPYHRTRSIFY